MDTRDTPAPFGSRAGRIRTANRKSGGKVKLAGQTAQVERNFPLVVTRG